MITQPGISRAAVLLLTNPGAYLPFPALNANVVETSALGARSQLNGNEARLRGSMEVSALAEVKVTESLFTLPVGVRPAATIEIGFALSPGSLRLLIEANGKVFPRTAIAEKVNIAIGGISFALT